MANTEKNLAYDLSLFEPKPKEQKRDNVIRLPKRNVIAKARIKLIASCVGISAVSVFMLSSVVYNQVQLTELTTNIYAANKNLDENQSIYTQLKMKLESNLSLREIEQYSKESLGMRKLEPSETEYISLCSKDKAELKKDDNNFLGKISDVLGKISDVLGKVWPF